MSWTGIRLQPLWITKIRKQPQIFAAGKNYHIKFYVLIKFRDPFHLLNLNNNWMRIIERHHHFNYVVVDEGKAYFSSRLRSWMTHQSSPKCVSALTLLLFEYTLLLNNRSHISNSNETSRSPKHLKPVPREACGVSSSTPQYYTIWFTVYFNFDLSMCLFSCIPESGRLFVWGENQFGQLGIGSTDIITKPSCVKAIKSLGHKVRNIAFGENFSVVLTGSVFIIRVDFKTINIYICIVSEANVERGVNDIVVTKWNTAFADDSNRTRSLP